MRRAAGASFHEQPRFATTPQPSPNGSPLLPLLRYLPLVMRVFAELPGVGMGIILAWALYLVAVGREMLVGVCAPVAGFHVTTLFLLRELFAPWSKGKAAAAEAQRRAMAQESFAQDVQLQWRERLD